MISRETIDEVKNRIDIVDVISDFISLKRAGQNYKALSPFNNEKTASFFVVPGKGIFKDFSSGKGGDAITFVMEHEGMSYTEAIRFLAKKYGVEINETAQSDELLEQQSEREGLYILMNFAKDYYKDNLFNTDEGRGIGLSYFHERGFNDRTVNKFELGYALEGWNHLSDAAVKANYNKDLLEKTGLVVKNEEGRTYDRFRGRVIFPVHNMSGKVIAFGARMLGKEKNQPKYINSPETEIYHKGAVLYGLYQAKNIIRQKDNCFLVEGYTDVISMHQADVENVVASSGTALTEDQIKLIRRFTDNVTVLFDGDDAGIRAALRGIDLILKGGLNVRVVLFPDGEDPDSFSRKVGTSEFQKYLADHSQDFISFKAGLFAKEAAADPVKKSEMIHDIVNTISLIPDHLKRTVFLQECSKIMAIPFQLINSEVNKLLIKRRIDEKQQGGPARKESSMLSLSDVHELSKSFVYDPVASVILLEKEFLKVLVLLGNMKTPNDEFVYEYLFHESEDIQLLDKSHQAVYDIYRAEVANGVVPTPESFLKSVPREYFQVVSDLMVQKFHISDGWSKKHIYVGPEYQPDEAPSKVVLRLKFGALNKMSVDNLEKIKGLPEGSEQDNLIDTLVNINLVKNQIAELLSIVVARNAVNQVANQ
ncbi:MAG TPA: DNA primase [Cyclobacteriaceae bacterium]|nr:DNA primase [Cyclobacteriaceae bacterium]